MKTEGYRTSRRMLSALGMVILPGVLTLAFAACSSGNSARDSASIEVLSNQEILEVLSKSQGKVTVVNFWATWCLPCIEEMPGLIRFQREYEPKGVRFISICLDDPDELDTRVVPFMNRLQIPFRVYVPGKHEPPSGLIDPIDPSWSGALPATFVFDQGGKVHEWWQRDIEFAELTEVVDPLLKGV
jgi:thiol-disulfide isomerase/thioredoxin